MGPIGALLIMQLIIGIVLGIVVWAFYPMLPFGDLNVPIAVALVYAAWKLINKGKPLM